MNCEECLAKLDVFVEDELDEEQSAQVSAHIDDCAECENDYHQLKHERQIYFRYFTSLDATPALWAGVQAGIEEIEHNRVSANRRRFRKRLAAAFGFLSSNPSYGAVALMLLMITLGAVIGVIKYRFAETNSQPELTFQKSDTPEIKPSSGGVAATNAQILHDEKDVCGKSANNSTSKIVAVRTENRERKNTFRSALPKRASQNSLSERAARQTTTDEVVKQAEQQYLNAVVMLSRDIKRRRLQLAPDLVSQLDESLAEIDRTIKETKRAVKAQPTDAVAIQYMTAAYAKKAELLRTIAMGN